MKIDIMKLPLESSFKSWDLDYPQNYERPCWECKTVQCMHSSFYFSSKSASLNEFARRIKIWWELLFKMKSCENENQETLLIEASAPRKCHNFLRHDWQVFFGHTRADEYLFPLRTKLRASVMIRCHLERSVDLFRNKNVLQKLLRRIA